MPAPAPEIVTLLATFAPAFTARTFARALVLVYGTLLAVGPRTVTAALRAVGRDHDPAFGTDHRVLNRAEWSPLQVSRLLLGLLVATCLAPDVPLLLVIDETWERRRGRRIAWRRWFRDPVRSGAGKPVREPRRALAERGARGPRAVEPSPLGLPLPDGASAGASHQRQAREAASDHHRPHADADPAGQTLAAGAGPGPDWGRRVRRDPAGARLPRGGADGPRHPAAPRRRPLRPAAAAGARQARPEAQEGRTAAKPEGAVGRSDDRLAPGDGRLVRWPDAGAGGGDRDGALAPVGERSAAAAVGAAARPGRHGAADGSVRHRSDRGGDAGGRMVRRPLDQRGDLRRGPGAPGRRNSAAVEHAGDGADHALPAGALPPGRADGQGVASACTPDAAGGVVRQGGGDLRRCVGGGALASAPPVAIRGLCRPGRVRPNPAPPLGQPDHPARRCRLNGQSPVLRHESNQERDADYVLARKDTHPTLAADVIGFFSGALGPNEGDYRLDRDQTAAKHQGRLEQRRWWIVSDLTVIAWLNPDGAWGDRRTIALVESERRVGAKTTIVRRSYLGSLDGDAAKLAGAVRGRRAPLQGKALRAELLAASYVAGAPWHNPE